MWKLKIIQLLKSSFFLPIVIFFLSSPPVHAQGATICDLSNQSEIKIDLSPNSFNSCPARFTLTITEAYDFFPTQNFRIISRESSNTESILGSVTLDSNLTGTTSNLGGYNANDTYTIFLIDSLGNRCSEPKQVTVTNCTIPTPTPTPPTGCIPYGGTCDSAQPNTCCASGSTVYECVDDTQDLSTLGTCRVPIGSVYSPSQSSAEPYDPCAGLPDGPTKTECETCRDTNIDRGGGTYTAFGCVPNDPTPFTTEVIRNAFGLSGGVAFLLLIYGSFLCLISRGNPERAQACRQTITSALVGLILILFSLFIYNILFGLGGLFPGFVNLFS